MQAISWNRIDGKFTLLCSLKMMNEEKIRVIGFEADKYMTSVMAGI
jgi:hypothetical protein